MRSFWPLFAVLLFFTLWFAYDGWLTSDPEVLHHQTFNRVGTIVLLLPTVLAARSVFFSDKRFAEDEELSSDPPDKWNFGAFILAPVWGLGNRVYWALLALVPVLGFAVQIFAGLKGQKRARNSYPWRSEAEYEYVQKIWNRWGIGVGIFWLVVYSLVFVGIFSNSPGA